MMMLCCMLLTACGGGKPSILTTDNEEFNFSLTVKEEELFYDEDTGYPANVTFVLNISPAANEDLVTYLTESGSFENREQVIHYLSFELQKQMQIRAGGQVINPVFCHFERSFDLKKDRVLLASFDLSGLSPSDKPTLAIESTVLGKTTVNFNLTELEIYKS